MSSDKALTAEFIETCRRMSTATLIFHTVVAERLGLNPSDHKCCDFVREHGPLTAGRLAELTGLTTGAITGVIDRLEKAGLVAREADPNDRRKVLVQLRPEAHKRMWPLFAGIAAATNGVCEQYTDDQLRLVMEVITKLSDASQEQAVRLRDADLSEGASLPPAAAAVASLLRPGEAHSEGPPPPKRRKPAAKKSR